MKPAQMAALKFFSLLFLLPGLAGLIVSAMISTHYLDTLPKWPAPDQMRITPRDIHGTVVYQTEEENRRLNRWNIPRWVFSCWGSGLVLSIWPNGASYTRWEQTTTKWMSTDEGSR